ncbi:bro-a [Helicoverpa armigera nucleopolyhedrovirus]|uniref:Bro-a n=1 Tax=Helicoverpa armigera nucleopolyhedrovirus TaxID=51313 RepID=Q91BW8_9ABAC|nr:bro-a [Helicoverpa armigera nucleopolyhedrovirus]AAK96307.1 bro-a [Helicoverpa armigera nucleopolyhedrovirus]
MSVTKIKFGDKEVETYTVDFNGEKWMVANPFAEALSYSNVNRAIRVHVSEKNQQNYEEFKSDRVGLTDSVTSLPRNIQAKTKFINRAGVFELINASDMPGAKRFQAWNNNDLLPSLCQEGEYKMARDAPADIAHGMNAVHVATNEGVAAPWMKDLHELRDAVVQKDKIIQAMSYENKELSLSLRTSNEKLQSANDKLMYFASALVESNNGLMKANERIENLANRMADIAQDVIAKPSDPQLLHSLAVCSMGGDQYAFLRPQKRSLKRSLDRLSVDEKDIVYKSDYVPNSMNVLNKVKERLPKEKYKARHNRITLHEDLTREDLLQAIESTVSSRQVAIIVNKATSNITSIGNNTTNK